MWLTDRLQYHLGILNVSRIKMLRSYCVVPLLTQGPNERDIPDIISITTMAGLKDQRIGISFPLIHPTTLSARNEGHPSCSLQTWRLHPDESPPPKLKVESDTREVDLGGHELFTSTLPVHKL